jgi:hypothetical protein
MQLNNPRGIWVVDNGDVLVLESGIPQVTGRIPSHPNFDNLV